MRIAVLADIHGNLPALQAVLAELDRDPVDAIALAGDVVPGPLPAECLAALRGRPEPLHWVTGNGERDVVAAFDDAGDEGDPQAAAARHSAAALTAADRDWLAGWPPIVTLGSVCVCHGSPRDVDEVLTRDTPADVLREAVSGVDAALVVGGHTHQQMTRPLGHGPDYANAGSIGQPYEGVAAAFWMIVDGARPEPRRTDYDVAAAIERLRAGGYPDFDGYVEDALGPFADPAWVAAYFEHEAGRGSDPGPPRRLN